MTLTSAVGSCNPYYQMGAFSPIPREVLLPNIFLRLELRDLYCVSLGSRQLCNLTLSDPGFLTLCLERYLPTYYRRSCRVQGVDYAALCKEIAIRKKNIREAHCAQLTLQCEPTPSLTRLCSSIRENRFLVFSMEEGVLRTWNYEGKLTEEWMPFLPPGIFSLRMDDQHLMIGSSDGTLQTFSFEQDAFSPPLHLEKDFLTYHFYAHGDHMITDRGDGRVKLWNRSGALINTLEGPEKYPFPSTCLHMDENYIVQGLKNGGVDVWSHEGLRLTGIPAPKGITGKASISYLLIREDLLFVGALYGAFTIWNLKTHTRVRTLLTCENTQGLDCDLKVVDDYLIVAEGRVLKIWDLTSESDQPIQRFTYDSHIRSTSMRENLLLVATSNSGVSILNFAPPPLLADLHIVTPKEHQKKLGHPALFLSRVGLCSLTDLQQLGPPLSIENQTTRLRAYLDQPDLLDIWEELKKLQSSNLHTLSALLKRYPEIDPFKLANYFKHEASL
jgi:hypothetical protein